MKTEISLLCAIVYWNGVVSISQTMGKLNSLADPTSTSALFVFSSQFLTVRQMAPVWGEVQAQAENGKEQAETGGLG